MREKLRKHIESLFRNAPDTPERRDLEAEILQNSLDRYDDLVSQGVPEEQAYRQTVDSLGDVRQLLSSDPQPKKKHAARNAAIACTAAVVLLAAVPLAFFGIRSERLEEQVENRIETIERDADHWANGIEEEVEQWVNQIDEEYGFSVIAPDSDIGYTDSERYTAGPAEIRVAELRSLSIDWMAGTVTVEVWDGDSVSIAESGAETEEQQVRWLLENDNALRIEYCAAGKHRTLPSKNLTVRIPETMAGDLRHLSIYGTSQDMTVTGVTAHSTSFFSNSGDLEFSGGTEQLRLETTSGDMTVRLDKAPDDLEFDSVSGGLKLTIPDGRGFEVDWDTISGDFECDFPGQKEEDDEWIFNPEENYAIRGEYEFETVSGDVTIQKG